MVHNPFSTVEAIWRDNDVRSTYGEFAKSLRHPWTGLLAEYSAFVVDGRPDLDLVIYNPATPEDAERISLLIKSQTNASW